MPPRAAPWEMKIGGGCPPTPSTLGAAEARIGVWRWEPCQGPCIVATSTRFRL
jgi:hypothetical protein